VPAIFEAALEHRGVIVRVDVLERLDRKAATFGLREVKQSASVKDDHLPDVAIQRWVARGAGLDVCSTQLVHLTKGYVRDASEVPDLAALFTRADLDARLDGSDQFSNRRVARSVAEQQAVLGASEAPREEPTRKLCGAKGSECPFWHHCTEGRPATFFVEGMRAKKDRRALYRRAAESGQRWVSPELESALAGSAPPIWYLDFESLGPAIPLFPGTSPHQQIAFQFSLHHLSEGGGVEHREFLARGDVDPRAETAAALVAALGRDAAPIAVYSDYESRMLRDMAAHCPEHAAALEAIRGRLFDLLPVVRKRVYDPAFEGSFSIKAVGPALTPDVRYDDLGDVANGNAAALAFSRIAAGELRGAEAKRTRAALLAYCERDTLALMRIHQALLEMARAAGAPRR
jgi:hypothetical protein